MIAILSIERKVLHIDVTTYYLLDKELHLNKPSHLIGYLHSFVPNTALNRLETNQMDLTKNEHELLMEVHRSTRQQIRKASTIGFEIHVYEDPTDEQLEAFQHFYNRFAKVKKTHLCTSYHIDTMKLLRDQNAIILTCLKDVDRKELCYRVYVVDEKIAMNLYSASHYRMEEDSQIRRKMSQASRFLIWENILFFKMKGYDVYDMGGLTEDEHIRQFKLSFGGHIVPYYSGYVAYTLKGKCLLSIRNIKMKLLRGIV